jgi:hypothetical protein
MTETASTSLEMDVETDNHPPYKRTLKMLCSILHAEIGRCKDIDELRNLLAAWVEATTACVMVESAMRTGLDKSRLERMRDGLLIEFDAERLRLVLVEEVSA